MRVVLVLAVVVLVVAVSSSVSRYVSRYASSCYVRFSVSSNVFVSSNDSSC